MHLNATKPLLKGQKGNVWALLLIAIVAIVFILVLTRHEPIAVPKTIETETKADTITQTNLMRGMRQGIQNFSKEGFSLQSSLWVCNVFMPPLANEIDEHFSLALRDDARACFSRLEKELGYSYSPDYKISLSLDANDSVSAQIDKMMSLSNEQVDMNVSFVVVETETDQEIRALSRNYSLAFPYRKWFAYKKYFEWGQTYLPLLGEDVCEELRKAEGPCLFIARGDPSYTILIPDEDVMGKVDLRDVNIDNALAKQEQYINDIMNPIDFECTLRKTFEEKGIAISRDQECTTPGCSGLTVQEFEVDGFCGAQEEMHGIACPPREKIGPWAAPPVGTQHYNNLQTCPAGTCKQETVGANPFAAFSFDFICEDKLRSISMDPSVEPSTVRISVFANIVRICPPVKPPV